MNETKGGGSPLPDPLVQTLASPAGGFRGGSPPGKGDPSFAIGEFIAGRYRVVRFLAEGGMGEVYECEDRLLGEQVALKTIRPEIANDATIIERFRREIQLARRVTHPHVCRIFDVGIHRRAVEEGGAEIDLAFLTMELLPGQTLAERLRASGPIPVTEALSIITQVAGALAAAHDAGVVHRDFKSQNVILVPANREGGQVRAVVTDFGLARGRVPDPRGADNVTGAGGIVGSPAYMAPEQVEGGEVGPAADIFALGVVLYEMVTGVLPYVGETPLATAAKRLKGPPLPPSRHVPDLERGWEAAILRCLAREPGERFAQAADLPAALRGERRLTDRIELLPGPPGHERRSRVRGLALGLALVLGGVGAGAGAAFWARNDDGEPSPTAGAAFDFEAHRDAWGHPVPPMPPMPPGEPRVIAIPDELRTRALEKMARAGEEFAHLWRWNEAGCGERTVAVIGFKNLSGNASVDWISTALSEMLSTELAAGEKLRTVPGESVSRMKRELALGNAESYAGDTLAHIRENVCATHVLVGSYIAQGGTEGTLRLDLRLQDTSTGETIAQVAENGRQDELIELVASAGGRLREAVGVEELSEAESQGARAVLPRSSAAARPYAEGLVKLRRDECRDAQVLLEEAVRADPEFALAHASLAEALWCVGYEEKGAAAAEKAFALSSNLPRRERLMVQGTVWSLKGEYEKALEAYQTLWEFYPNEIEFGLKLAGQQASMKKEQEFRATVAQLRKLPAPDNQHPRIDMYEARLASMTGNPAGVRPALERAVKRAEARGAKLMAAGARMDLTFHYLDSGESAAARAAAESILEVGREFGDRELEAVGLDVLATLDGHAGELKSAEKLVRASLKVVREVGIQRRLPRGLVHLAWILALQGRLDEAEAALKQMPARKPTGKDQSKAKKGHWNDPGVHIARLAILRGDVGAAERALGTRDAAAEPGSSSDPEGNDAEKKTKPVDAYGRADALVARAELLRARGDTDGAMAALDEARRLTREKPSPVFLAYLDLEVARTHEAAGRFVQAAELAEDVARRFYGFGMKDCESEARAVQAGALLASGKPAEARAVLDPALAWAAQTESQPVRIGVGIVDARLLGAVGDPESRKHAGQKLSALVVLGHELGLGSLELEAALALGEQELAMGQTASGRARLARVERVAKEKGFSAFARRAAAAVGS